MPIVLGYRADVGTIGGRLLVLESFVDLVLIALLWPVPTSIWRLLLHRRTGANRPPAAWAVGTGGGASRSAQKPASGGRDGAWKVPVSIGRFEADLRGLRGPLNCCARRCGGDGVRPDAQGSDARMCEGRLVTVGTHARPPPDVRRARAALRADAQPQTSDEQAMSVCSVCICML